MWQGDFMWIPLLLVSEGRGRMAPSCDDICMGVHAGFMENWYTIFASATCVLTVLRLFASSPFVIQAD